LLESSVEEGVLRFVRGALKGIKRGLTIVRYEARRDVDKWRVCT
jgi:hypothetical protein